MLNKIASIQVTVKQLLIKFPEARDNDRLLILKIWVEQNIDLRHKRDHYLFKQFAIDFMQGEYVDPATISRCRRKLQDVHHELRGKNWYKRHHAAEKVAAGIGELDM